MSLTKIFNYACAVVGEVQALVDRNASARRVRDRQESDALAEVQVLRERVAGLASELSRAKGDSSEERQRIREECEQLREAGTSGGIDFSLGGEVGLWCCCCGAAVTNIIVVVAALFHV
jgi:uncharacterized protein YlxW (UPF0749 family)